MKKGDKALITIDPAPLPDVVGDGDSWQITASGDCIGDYLGSTVNTSGTSASTGLIDDQNRFVFDTSKLVPNQAAVSCDVTVMVKHMHYSQIDPSYGGPTADLSLIYSDAPQKDGTVDISYAIEGIQARAFHVTFSAP